jgi:alpha-amylase/alpha-mannosidase (GH57 family)
MTISTVISPIFDREINSLEIATGVYVTIHGHFYQPPRENPYLDTIECQPTALPFHDWNERIYYECYRPNAFARIFNDAGNIVGIVNNFEYISFNVGPTLMSWLEHYDLEVYKRILEGDRQSAARLNGHGNAIAQIYNHVILPLANERDKITQIRWGKQEFCHRFGRDPEGMWLAETAVDYATIKILIQEGIKFLILAPSQAERCRPFATEENPDPEWYEVGGSQIDPTRPYRCFIDEEKTEFIEIFFYDGPISRDMGFNDVLSNSYHFAGRIGQAIRGDHRPSQLISVATDGETFGHHKMGTEKCIAYSLLEEFPKRGWTVTNYGHYLSICPPSWEVILKPVTAWSCSHGVDRWQDDCGCGSGGEWHQKWRKPLRESLNWLRDRLVNIYDQIGSKFFNNTWLARDEYIEVILNRSLDKVDQFLSRHQRHQLSPSEQIDALRLLEMQRHALLMFTSCGWFFEEISRPEGVQILRYAARAIELAAEVGGVQLEREFIEMLEVAPSNVKKYHNGAEVYRQFVLTSQISLKQVAAHYAISSLFNSYNQEQQVYCYSAQQLDYQKQQIGSLSLAVGQVRLVSNITWESNHFVFGILHLGGWDFHCCIQPFMGRNDYTKLKEILFQNLKDASVVQLILRMSELFGYESFGLQHIFIEERHRIMQQLTENTKKSLDQLYTQIYRDNYSILMAFHRDELAVPQELQVAAEVALSHRCLKTILELEHSLNSPEQMYLCLAELRAIATEANCLQCQLHIAESKQILEQLMLKYLWYLLQDSEPLDLEDNVRCLETMIEVSQNLHCEVSLEKVQELYYNYLHNQLIPNCLDSKSNAVAYRWNPNKISPLLRLGQRLGVEFGSF